MCKFVQFYIEGEKSVHFTLDFYVESINSICDIVSQEDILVFKNKGINCFWKNVVNYNFVLLVCNKIIIYDT